MGYIILDVKQKENLKRFKFFYGKYSDGIWNAKLIDEATSDELEFSYNTLNECFRELVRLLKKFGRVQGIKGSVMESQFIEKLSKNLSF